MVLLETCMAPPEDPRHSSQLSMAGRLKSDAWASTMQSMQRFVDRGYEVRYVWSHEFRRFAPWGVAAHTRRPRPRTSFCPWYTVSRLKLSAGSRYAPLRGAPGATATGALAACWALPLLVAHEIGYTRVFELGLWQLLL